MRTRWLAWLASLVWSNNVHADQLRIGDGTKIVFASVEAGQRVLGSRDAFIARLSPFDRAARLHTDREVTEDEFLQHVRDSVVSWNDDERGRVAAAWERLAPALEKLALPFPAEIQLIATTGAEEGGAAYTRGTAVVLAPGDRSRAPHALAGLLAHELFHVLTRHAPALKTRCYAVLGFHPCGELEFPVAWRARQITNPDAPFMDHAITVTIDGQITAAMPVLVASAEHYDVARGGEFFEYLQAGLLPVQCAPPGGITVAAPTPDGPRLVGFNVPPDFFTQVGRNTDYIIHPEEILAENFRHLVMATPGLPSPEIMERLRHALTPSDTE